MEACRNFWYVISDSAGFVGAFNSMEAARLEVIAKYDLIPFLVQKFPVAEEFPQNTVWVVIYNNTDIVAFVSNSRDDAKAKQSILTSVGFAYSDNIDFWAQPTNCISPSAIQRLEMSKIVSTMGYKLTELDDLEHKLFEANKPAEVINILEDVVDVGEHHGPTSTVQYFLDPELAPEPGCAFAAPVMYHPGEFRGGDDEDLGDNSGADERKGDEPDTGDDSGADERKGNEPDIGDDSGADERKGNEPDTGNDSGADERKGNEPDTDSDSNRPCEPTSGPASGPASGPTSGSDEPGTAESLHSPPTYIE